MTARAAIALLCALAHAAVADEHDAERAFRNAQQRAAAGDPIAIDGVCLTAIAEGGVEWETDPDFGYEIPKKLGGIDPELVQPRLAFDRLGRGEEYAERVATRKAERRAFLETFPGLDTDIVSGV